MGIPKFQLFKSTADAQYYFRLKAANGETVLSSEGYTTSQSCLGGIASVKVNAPIDSRYDRKDAAGNYRFNLKAANGEIIGRSQGYTTVAARENGIEAVKKDAPDAPIEELS